jgi:predicted glycosyltransferase
VTASPRVFFYVQHLLGIGHLKRAAVLVEAMLAAGLDVTVALGGEPVAGIGFPGASRILLPPVRAADASFKTLITNEGEPLTPAFKDRRVHRLLFEFSALRPDLLLIEQFPFGRLAFRFELLPLIEAARARPRPAAVCCSLRDVLVHKGDPARTQTMLAIARRFFDSILVHGDPRLLPLEASLPEAAMLADRILYTGYVSEAAPAGEPAAAMTGDGAGEVVVLAGGGAVGRPLMELALAARPLTPLAARVWRLITGPNLDEAAFAALAWASPPGVIVERWRDDVRALLRRCHLVLCQAGYNTVMDLLATRAPAVVVPFATERETEQGLRARALAKRGAFVLLDDPDPSPNLLAAAIEQALTRPPAFVDVDLTGAEKTAQLVKTMARPRAGNGGCA